MGDESTQVNWEEFDRLNQMSFDFGQIPSRNEFLLSDIENSSKKSPLEPQKPQGLSGPIKAILVFEGQEIKSDPELIEFWMMQKALQTCKAYRIELKRFRKFTGGMGLKELSIPVLFKYAESMETTLSVNSQAIALATIKSLLSFGFKVGYLEKNLGSFLKLPKIHDRRGRKVAEESKIQEMIFSEPDPRNKLILRLSYHAGLRVSELCSLKWRDCQAREKSGQLVIIGKGNKQRTILVAVPMWEELTSYKDKVKPVSDFLPVFLSRKKNARGRGHLSRETVFELFKTAGTRVGLPWFSPHCARHSHATHAIARGVKWTTLRDTLGHNSIKTSEKYAQSRPDESSCLVLGI